MTSRYDIRKNAEYKHLVAQHLPKLATKPLVGALELAEVLKVLQGLGTNLDNLEFPVNSAGELVDKLCSADSFYEIVGVQVDPFRMIKYMPAYYFPIVDLTNFIEKIAALIVENRPKIDASEELKLLKRQLPYLTFPIQDAAEMIEAVAREGVNINFRGGRVNMAEAVKRVPKDFFPITSEEDFDRKVKHAIQSRPLIQKDDPSRPVLI